MGWLFMGWFSENGWLMDWKVQDTFLHVSGAPGVDGYRVGLSSPSRLQIVLGLSM